MCRCFPERLNHFPQNSARLHQIFTAAGQCFQNVVNISADFLRLLQNAKRRILGILKNIIIFNPFWRKYSWHEEILEQIFLNCGKKIELAFLTSRPSRGALGRPTKRAAVIAQPLRRGAGPVGARVEEVAQRRPAAGPPSRRWDVLKCNCNITLIKISEKSYVLEVLKWSCQRIWVVVPVLRHFERGAVRPLQSCVFM